MKNKPSLIKLFFTAVIIFILLGIGSFGIKYFTASAKNSKALSELKEAQQIMLTNLMSTDGTIDKKIVCDGISFTCNISKGKVVFEGEVVSNDNGETLTKELLENIPELKELSGTYKFEDGLIVYTTKDGEGQAYWESGKVASKTK